MTERYLPQPGDRVLYTVEAEVVGCYAGNRILALRADDGKRWMLPYDSGSLYDEHGVTVLPALRPVQDVS